MASYLSMKSAQLEGDISVMKQAMGVMQHHDAITGTSMNFVIDDYSRILYRGFEECLEIQNSFYKYTIYYLPSSRTLHHYITIIFLERNCQNRICHQ